MPEDKERQLIRFDRFIGCDCGFGYNPADFFDEDRTFGFIENVFWRGSNSSGSSFLGNCRSIHIFTTSQLLPPAIIPLVLVQWKIFGQSQGYRQA